MRQVYVHDVVDRQKRIERATQEADLHRIANDFEESQQKRLYIRYERGAHSYLLGAYKGHSAPVVEHGESNLVDNPVYYCRATTWRGVCEILRPRIRAMDRNDIHLAPLHLGKRPDTYLRPPTTRISHIIVIGGRMAKTACVNCPHLGNGVVTARGIGGSFRTSALPAYGATPDEYVEIWT